MSNTTKSPRAGVMAQASKIIEAIRPYCERVEVAGSLRRGRPMVGDIEITAIPRRPVDLFGSPIPKRATALDEFLLNTVKTLPKNGAKYKQFRFAGRQVDLFLPTPDTWGAIFLIRTGSHEFNLWLMDTICPARGVRFHEGRVYANGGRLLDTPEEADVFAALDLPYIPVGKRDNGAWLHVVRDGGTAAEQQPNAWLVTAGEEA